MLPTNVMIRASLSGFSDCKASIEPMNLNVCDYEVREVRFILSLNFSTNG